MFVLMERFPSHLFMVQTIPGSREISKHSNAMSDVISTSALTINKLAYLYSIHSLESRFTALDKHSSPMWAGANRLPNLFGIVPGVLSRLDETYEFAVSRI